MTPGRKSKKTVVCHSSTFLTSFISICQKAFDNVGLGAVLWQRRSSWFVSMKQRSPSWMCDSRSSLSRGKKKITWHPEFQIPLLNRYLISLSASFSSTVAVCLIAWANSVSLKILVNQGSVWRTWTCLYSVSQAFQGVGLLIKLSYADAT